MNPKSKLELLANGRIENGKKCGAFVKSSVNLMVFVEPFWVNETFSSLTSIMALCGNFFGLVDQKTLHLLLHQFESRLGSFEVFDDGLDVFGRSASAVHILFFLFRLRVLLSHLEHGSLRLLARLGDGLKKLPNPKSSGKVLAQCEVMRNLLKTLKIIFEKKTSHSNLQG